MKWKYNPNNKTYESDNFLIVKKVSFWGYWFAIFRKEDNIRIKDGVKKLSQGKRICEMLINK